MCYSTALLRVFSVQGKATNSDWQVCLGSPLWDCTTGRVDDDPSGASTYAKIRNLANGYAKDQQIVGQRFDRGYDVEAADLKISGDITNVLVGLQPDTKYGNWNYDSTAGGLRWSCWLIWLVRTIRGLIRCRLCTPVCM